MKRWAWWWGVGIVLAAVLVAPLARAQSGIVLDGKKVSGIYMSGLLWWPGDSTIRVPRADQYGNAMTDEAFKSRDLILFKPSVLSDQFLHIPGVMPTTGYAAGCVVADSTGAIDTHQCHRLALLVFPTLDDSTWAATYAIQLRGHYAAVTDSQNTFTNWPVVRAVSGSPASQNYQAPDSVGSLSAARDYIASTEDRAAMLDEFVLVVSKPSCNPRGMLVFLTNRDGTPFQADQMSFRIRPLNTYNASGTAYAATNEQRTRMREDLLGWR